MTLHQLLSRLWDDYAALNPQARVIQDLLTTHQAGDATTGADSHQRIVNDHIAFRTFDDPRIGIDALAGPFVKHGYEARAAYEFPQKKLVAKHYEHRDPTNPKIFISQLKVGEFSAPFGRIVAGLLDQLPDGLPQRDDLPVVGRLWDVSYRDYETLRAQSEYGAWLAAWGLRANHFTVDVGRLGGFENLAVFNDYLEEQGFELNASGGKVKGGPEVYLEQSSTLAAEARAPFTDGQHMIPSCYYEFAWRYTMPGGQRFEGFVAGSADKIFESTDRRDA